MDGYYDDQNRANSRYGNFTYRFYLGGNSTTDFSLVRNRHYEIIIELNDDGVDEVSWRVDEDLTPYVTSIVVNPSEYTFWGITGTCQLTATVRPATAVSTATWSSSNPAVATVSANCDGVFDESIESAALGPTPETVISILKQRSSS